MSAEVSGGCNTSAQCWAATPMSEKSAGTLIPARCRARWKPGNAASFTVATAVTSGCRSRICAMQASPDGSASELAKRYPKVEVRDFDGDKERVTEMDALVAYLQSLGTHVDFKSAAAQEQSK